MSDILMLGIAALFGLTSWLLVGLCGRLMGGEN
jgi:hypothetical protein